MKRIIVSLFTTSAISLMAYVLYSQHTLIANTKLENPWLLLLAALMHIIFWLASISFWRKAVYVTTQHELTLFQSHRHLALVATGKYLPGKVWGFIARAAALKLTNTSTGGIFASAFIEQWIMLMSACLISGCLMLLLHRNAMLVGISVMAIIVSLLGNYFYQFGIGIFKQLLTFISNVNKVEQSIPISNEQYFALLMMHSVMWLLIGAVFSIIYFAYSTRSLSIELFAALTLADIIGIVSGFAALFAPGGIGVREAMTTIVLIPFMQIEEAAILSITFRIWTTVIDLLLALSIAKFSIKKI